MSETNTVIPQPPKSCNYVALKDYLQYSRKDNDYFAYEVNKIKSPEQECAQVWNKLQSSSTHRISLISNCIGETELLIKRADSQLQSQNNVNNTNNINSNSTSSKNNSNSNSSSNEQAINKKKLQNKLNLLNMEKEIEQVFQEHAKKIFHKICKEEDDASYY